MKFIASTVPIEEVKENCKGKTHEEMALYAASLDFFLFSDCVFDGYRVCDMMRRLYIYPMFYKEKLYVYIISDNYYYKNYNLLPKTSSLINMKRVPERGFDEEKYPRIPPDERLWEITDFEYIDNITKQLKKVKLREEGIHCVVLG